MMKRRIVCVLLALLIALPLAAGCQKGPGELTLYGVNTGKADCLLFCLPDGQSLLVDTGLKDTYPRVKAVLELAGVRKIDHLILTHGHKDHIGGLEQLAKDFKIGTIYTNAYDTDTYSKKEQKFLLGIAKNWEQPRPAMEDAEGRTLAGLLLGNVSVNFLAPSRAYSDAEDDNNNSLVLRITHGDVVFLLMADATGLIEEELLSWYGPPEYGGGTHYLSASFLKAGHHGQAGANTQAFIEAVAPEAVYLTGNRAEDVDSPDEAVLGRYEAIGAETYINEGNQLAIVWVSDGAALSTGEYINAD